MAFLGTPSINPHASFAILCRKISARKIYDVVLTLIFTCPIQTIEKPVNIARNCKKGSKPFKQRQQDPQVTFHEILIGS